MRGTRSGRGAVAVIVGALVLLAAGCQWTNPRFDIGGTGFNRFEGGVSAANVGQLAEEWTATVGGGGYAKVPVASDGLVFVGAGAAPDGGLRAYPALGSLCDSVTECQPAWTAAGSASYGQPTTAGGRVFVDAGTTLHVYDAKGVEGCSGTPRTCSPLWTGTTDGMSPLVVGDTLFVYGGSNQIAAYEAFDTSGCSGSPLVCAPIRTYDLLSAPCPGLTICSFTGPLVADGDTFYATYREQGDRFWSSATVGFDIDGDQGCVTPTSCQYTTSSSLGEAGGVAATGGSLFGGSGYTDIYTAASEFRVGASGVSGGPSWSGPLAGLGGTRGVAVDDEHVWVTTETFLLAYDRDGGCGTTCTPVRRSTLPAAPWAHPAVANGLVFVATANALVIYDATNAGCTGSPLTCPSLRSIPLSSVPRGLSVTNGRVFVPTADGKLHVFAVPS